MPLDRLGRPERAKNQTSKTPRDKVYLEIVRKLNEQGMQGEEKNIRMLVDCKGLGILLICWGYGGWKREWFDKIKDATEFVDIKTLTALLPRKTK